MYKLLGGKYVYTYVQIIESFSALEIKKISRITNIIVKKKINK